MTLAMRQAIHILQMPTDELSLWLEKEIIKNPLIQLNTSFCLPENYDVPSTPTMKECLKQELPLLFSCQRTLDIALVLIEFLDERGYLSETYSEIAGFCRTTPEIIETIAYAISQIEPKGLATPDLKHCLLAQLSSGSKGYQIIANHWEKLAKNQKKLISKAMNISPDEIERIIETEIRTLNPNPGQIFQQAFSSKITPDLIVTDELKLILPQNTLPSLVMETYDATSEEDKQFMRQWLSSAKWLQRAVDRRYRTLLGIGTYILNQQIPFLTGQAETPSPIKMADLAAELHLTVSTIARALSNKYIDTPRGTFPLTFFTSSTKLDKDYHIVEVHDALKQAIKEETTPLTDQQLADHLASKGITISRRTVTKYRKQLNIPSARQR